MEPMSLMSIIASGGSLLDYVGMSQGAPGGVPTPMAPTSGVTPGQMSSYQDQLANPQPQMMVKDMEQQYGQARDVFQQAPPVTMGGLMNMMNGMPQPQQQQRSFYQNPYIMSLMG